MPVSRKSAVVSKFPLRLMPSVRRVAESISAKEGVSLNQFINIAVAEKLAHLQHQEWLERRPKVSQALIANALEVLNGPPGNAPEESDRLPVGYVSVRRRKAAGKRVSRSRIG